MLNSPIITNSYFFLNNFSFKYTFYCGTGLLTVDFVVSRLCFQQSKIKVQLIQVCHLIKNFQIFTSPTYYGPLMDGYKKFLEKISAHSFLKVCFHMKPLTFNLPKNKLSLTNYSDKFCNLF